VFYTEVCIEIDRTVVLETFFV